MTDPLPKSEIPPALRQLLRLVHKMDGPTAAQFFKEVPTPNAEEVLDKLARTRFLRKEGDRYYLGEVGVLFAFDPGARDVEWPPKP
jgi:hypothetical protein